MNKTFKYLTIIVLAFFTAAFSSCSTNKLAVKNNLKEISANKLVDEIEQNNLAFDEFQAKFNEKIETADANLSVKGQLRMKNDSIIWISISLPLGLEVIRVKITSDSVFMINRTDKTYLKENILKFKEIPATVAEIGLIQSLLIGNGNFMKSADKIQVRTNQDMYNMLITKKIKNFANEKKNNIDVLTEEILVLPENFKIKNYTLKEEIENGKKLELKYDDYEAFDEKIIPTEINLAITGKSEFNVNISYSNICLNAEQDYKFSIPKKFTPVK